MRARKDFRSFAKFAPVAAALIASLVLSAIAVLFAEGPNRDGMLYVDTANRFLASGWEAAQASFDWPVFPAIIGLFSLVTGASAEASGFILSALLMAGVCALSVAVSGKMFRGSEWPTFLVVLAVPAFNSYRDSILREFGCWFFVLLSIYLALCWRSDRSWAVIAAMCMAVLAATAFRLEAIVFLPVLVFWVLRQINVPKNVWGAVCLFGFLGAAALVSIKAGALELELHHRVTYYLSAIDPYHAWMRLEVAADQVAAAILNYYKQDAIVIVVAGLISIIPYKFVSMLGAGLVPLVVALRSEYVGSLWRKTAPISWCFLVYLVVLSVFMVHQFFLTGRYVAFLNLMAVPVMGYGMMVLLERYARWRPVIYTLTALLMLANVVSLSPGKTYFKDAGRWLAANIERSDAIYMGSPRSAYHAGWSYAAAKEPLASLEDGERVFQDGRYDWVILEGKISLEELGQIARREGYASCQSFSGIRGAAVSVYTRPGLCERNEGLAHGN